ncbi:hypothetical protein QA596_00990 [Balneolales bacterium ANBcel1]|nr:hypothetical protein [Balneolales bacterium ANBcel1]
MIGLKRTAVAVMMVVMAGGVVSCTSTSQVPLSIRNAQERDVADTTRMANGADDRDADTPLTEEEREQEEARLEELRLARERAAEEIRRREQELEENYFERTNKSLSLYVKAQTAYFSGDFDTALELVREGIAVNDSPDLYALKGSIYYSMGQGEQAGRYWRRAVDADGEVVCDMYPGLRSWYEERNR